SAGLREQFGAPAVDLTSELGRIRALNYVSGKLQNPVLRQRFLDLGLTTEDLAGLDTLRGQLHGDLQAGLVDKSNAAVESPQLQAAKALVLGDMIMLAHVARADLPPERAHVYQIGKLLPQGR